MKSKFVQKKTSLKNFQKARQRFRLFISWLTSPEITGNQKSAKKLHKISRKLLGENKTRKPLQISGNFYSKSRKFIRKPTKMGKNCKERCLNTKINWFSPVSENHFLIERDHSTLKTCGLLFNWVKVLIKN